MGEVVLVRDSYLKKELALKLLHPSVNDEGELEQLQKEFALLSQIEHPGIARAYDFGYLPCGLRKRPYFTREFVPGEPLSQDGAPFDLPRFLSEAGDITEAVAFLHRGSILHLDIKPSNIIVSTKGRNCPGGGSEERRRAILIDFGLFRRGAPARGGAKIKGSLPYMAPECFRREAIGPWTDIYALGVTFYRLTTGSFPRRPPSSSNDNLAGPILDPAPKPPSDLCPSVPRDLDEVILKCLALDPSSRFSSAVELHDAFNVLARQSSSQQAPSGRGQKASSRAATSPLPEPLTVGRDVELLK